MGLNKSKLAHHEPINVESQRYNRLEESRGSNGFDSRNKSCVIQSHKDAWSKSEFSTKINRLTTPSDISWHETNPKTSIKENRNSKKRHPHDSDTESHEKDDLVTDTSKKKQNQSKKKKKKKATAERLSKRVVIPEQSELQYSANTIIDVANDSEGKSSSRNNGRLPDEPFNIVKTRQEENNMHDGNDMTRHDRPSSADMFLASGVLTKQNEDEITRQEPDIKIQAMTEEAERLDF